MPDRMKLPVLSIVVVAYQVLFSNIRTFLRLVWIPFCVCVVGSTVPIAFPEQLEGGDKVIFSLLYHGIALASWLSTIPAITAWHRLVIFGPENPDARIRYVIGKTEWAYLGLAVLLYIALNLIYLVAAMGIAMTSEPIFLSLGSHELVNEIVVTAGWLVGLFATSGFLLALPSAAIGRKLSLLGSFAAVRGNIIRLFVTYLLAILPEYLLLQILYVLYPDGSETTGLGLIIGYIVLENIVIFGFFTFAVSVLSVAYKLLVFSSPSPQEA